MSFLKEALGNQMREEDDALSNPLLQKKGHKSKRPDYESEPPPVTLGEDGNYYANDNRWTPGVGWSTIVMDEPVYYVEGGNERSKVDADQWEYDEFGNVVTKDADFAANNKAINPAGKWMTEQEIRNRWNSDTGMKNFKKANPDMSADDYMGFLKETTALKAQGIERLGEEGLNPAYSELYDKYGINTQYTGKDGRIFEFNGSGYTLTVDGVDRNSAILHGVSKGILAAGIGAGVSGALTGGLQAKGLSAGMSKGLAGATGNLAGQVATGGDIDFRSALASGLMAGFNPGGKLIEKLGNAGITGPVPNNFSGGFISGAVNKGLSSAISKGEVDFKDIMLAGFMEGGANAVKDFFDDAKWYSIEQQMKKIADKNPDLSQTELFERAMKMTGTGVSDLGGLVGEGGLLSFIPKVPTTWVNRLMGGGSFYSDMVYIGPDGKEYTDTEILEKGLDPAEIGRASWLGQDVDGWTAARSSYEQTPLGKLLSKIPGAEKASDIFNDAMDSMARAQFKSEYGFDPVENPDAARQVFLYGPVDEVYSWSDNPRGDSEVIGQLQELEDKWSTGPDWNEQFASDGTPLYQIIKYVQDASASGLTSSNIITNLGDIAQATLPGSNVSIGDAIISGFLDGITLGGDDDNDLNNELVDPNTGGELPGGELPPPPPPPATPPPGNDNTGELPSAGGIAEIDFTGDWTPPPELPPPSSPPPAELPGGPPPELPGGIAPRGRFDPKWGELFGYTTLPPYQKKGLLNPNIKI